MEEDKVIVTSTSTSEEGGSEDKPAEETSAIPDNDSISLSNPDPAAGTEDRSNLSGNSTESDKDVEINAESPGLSDHDHEEIILDEDDEEDENKPGNGPRVTMSKVLIELDDNLKSKLVSDLMQICEVDEDTAKSTLEAHRWSMQDAIDILLAGNTSNEEEEDDDEVKMAVDTDDEKDKPQTSSFPNEGASTSANPMPLTLTTPGTSFLDALCSPGGDGIKEKLMEFELPTTPGGSFSNWAPDKFSILSWNVDGLDDKNLELRTNYVIDLVEKEKHDVLFFQELLPYTFDYIARRLLANYKPIPGTEDSGCQYLTATFLKKNSVHYEDHYVMPFPNSAMGRTVLVTKAFIGRAKLALLNTHLESTAEFVTQRKEQLGTCLEISSTFDKEYNVLFGGDLNLRDKELGDGLPSSMCDLWVQCGSRATCQYTWDLTRNTNKQMPSKFQPRCRFDRFYFRNSDPLTLSPEFFGVTGIEKVPGTQSFPSDHWAIICYLALTKEARKPPPRKRRAEIDGLPGDE